VASILTIIPTFNEATNITDLVRRLLALDPVMDVLVVDDGSPDGTADRVADIRRESTRVHLIRRAGKGGRGSAVLEGFRFGLERKYDFFIEMDADFSHRPEEISSMLCAIENADMVVASRYFPGSSIHHWGWKRTLFSALANRFARLMLGIPISDYTNGFRCYRRCAVEALAMDHIDAKGYVVLSEVAMQLHSQGKKIREVPTIFVNRRRGISNLSLREVREAFLSVIRISRRYRLSPTSRKSDQSPTRSSSIRNG
jgi:dolichol-phosphate mannosyltransferase